MLYYITHNIKYIILHLLILGFMYVILLRETYVEGYSVGDLGRDIGGAAKSAGGAITGAVNSAGDALKDAGGQITAAGYATLAGLRQAADGVVYNATAAYNTVKDTATQIGGFVNGLISGLLSALFNGLASNVSRLLREFNKALSAVNVVLDKATHFEQNVVNSIKNSTTYTYNSADLVNEVNNAVNTKTETYVMLPGMQFTGTPAEIYAEASAWLDDQLETTSQLYLSGGINEKQYQQFLTAVASIRNDLKAKYRIQTTTQYVLWEDTPEGRAKLAATKAAAKAVAKAVAEIQYNKLIAKADSMMTNFNTMFQTGKITIAQYRYVESVMNGERIKARNALDNFDQWFEQQYQYTG